MMRQWENYIDIAESARDVVDVRWQLCILGNNDFDERWKKLINCFCFGFTSRVSFFASEVDMKLFKMQKFNL